MGKNFKNQWANGGELYPYDVLESSSTQNVAVTGLPNVFLEDQSKAKIEMGVETLLRLKVEGIPDNSWGGTKYKIELSCVNTGVTLSTMKWRAERGWALQTIVKSNQKGEIRINVKVNDSIKNDIVLTFYEVDNSVKSLTGFGVNGFTNVKKDDGEIVSIPMYFKVSNVKFNEGRSREEFIMLEWPFINQRASVKCEFVGKSRFSEINYESPAKIYIDKSNGELKYGNTVISAYTDVGNPIPNGTYNIWLPDYPHPGGAGYVNDTIYAFIWFRLGSESSSRYLHVGTVSAGCVSVGRSSDSDPTPEPEKWTNLYKYLSKRRSGIKYIGEIIVS